MALSIAIVLLTGWGLFAFGAVYPWAYWPLLAGAASIGVWGAVAGRSGFGGQEAGHHGDHGAAEAGHYRNKSHAPTRGGPKLVAAGLLLVTLAGLVQLVPATHETLLRLSPATVDLLQKLDALFAADPSGTHPVSVRPEATRLALAFLVCFSVLLLGLSRGFSTIGARTVSTGIVVLGVAAALAAIIQSASHTTKIYGFWTPVQGGNPFGPFVNKNHFAGWMVMALALALGYLAGRIARAMKGVKPGWREKTLWWSSPSASKLVLVAAAIVVMALALVLSLSRSGITCFLLSVLVTGSFVARRQSGSARKAATLTYLVLLVAAVTGWVGLDLIASRFATASWDTLGGRWGAWDDAWRVARTFWLTGTGLNTYGIVTLLYQTHDLAFHYVEAHNDYLQIAAEGGLLVGIPALIAVAMFVREVRRRFREGADDAMTYWLRVGAVTGIVAIAFQEVVEFSLQIPGNAVLFVVLAAMGMHETKSRAS